MAPVVMAEPTAVEPAPDRQDNGAELDPLFAEQDELLREAEQMGYEAVTLPASGDLPAEPSVAPLNACHGRARANCAGRGGGRRRSRSLDGLQHAKPAWQAQSVAQSPAQRTVCGDQRCARSARQTGGSRQTGNCNTVSFRHVIPGVRAATGAS